MHGPNIKVLAISLLILCCVLPTTVQGSTVANKPAYGATSHWTYGDIKFDNPAVVWTGNATMTVTSTSVTKNGMKCFVVSLTRPATNPINSIGLSSWQPANNEMVTNTYNQTITQWYRTSDLAMVERDLAYTINGETHTTRLVYDPPMSIFRFPMKVGDKWSVSQTIHVIWVDPMGGEIKKDDHSSANYTVVSEESVTVAAGTFDTLKINEDFGHGFINTYWYAPTAGTYVKVQFKPNIYPCIMELKEYSFISSPSDGGGSTVLGGMMYPLLVIILIVVVVLAVVMVRRKKKVAPVQPAPDTQPGEPTAPTTYAPTQQQPYQPPQTG
jgi:hypothetical protein